jgi:PAS domain S-box-containing protein
MTARARDRGLAHFRDLLADFSEAVVEGKQRSERLTGPTEDLVQESHTLREAFEELRTHQEELAVADEEMRAQLDELSIARSRVQAERDRYRELFDVAPDAYFVTDRVGAIRTVNAEGATMLAIDPKFLLGKPLAALVDAADTRLLRDAMSALQKEAHAEVELRFKPRGGEPRWHALKGVNVEQSTAVLWIARDIQKNHDSSAARASTNDDLAGARGRELERANRDKSELLERERHLRRQLEEEHTAKDRFLSLLSHELRAPLNSVLGWTQLLRREKLDESARDRALATIERNAQAQLELVEELLDISRLAVDRVSLDRVPVDLHEVVDRAIGSARADARERRNVSVRAELCGGRLLVAGDRKRLERVAANLLANALERTPSGGTIAITLDHDDASARLRVADTGPGIAPDRLAHAFDTFAHAGADYATTYDGLGLYVVRQLVLMHGGQVTAESTEASSGASFIVRLPLAGIHAPQGSPSLPRAPSTPDVLQGLSVLVVDDDADARELTAVILRQRGAVVAVAGDVSAALQAFALSPPDVLVSDVAMPVRDGHDLVRELRARTTTTTAMIAVSGFTSPEEVDRALRAGFDMHVAKPVDPDDLVNAVRDAARLRAH